MTSTISQSEVPPEFNEPFSAGRSGSRLLFDFSIMLSCLKDRPANDRILDFAAGTGWISEFLNRCGYNVTAFDLNSDTERMLATRADYDSRLSRNRFSFKAGDGHHMPFSDGEFGHVCCFDSLHHMHDYPQVFSEFHRVLAKGGRIVFVEPGAKHSTSAETINFIKTYKKDDPTWIERDVVLEEIWQIARKAGFKSMTIRPCLLPELREYPVDDWLAFRAGDNKALGADYLEWLKQFNYDSRVIFYLDK